EFERTQDDSLPLPIFLTLRVEPGKRTKQQVADLRAFYIENVYAPTRTAFAPLQAERDRLRKKVAAVEKDIPSAMGMSGPPERADTHVLIRGEYSQKGEKVNPGVPTFLPPLPSGTKADRLLFARWLTAPGHPLTARVVVNRVWQMHFGVGLVETTEDFGTQ